MNTKSFIVHRVDVKGDDLQDKLEYFLNDLQGDIVSIIPHVRPTFQFMGATAKVDYVLVVEKVELV